MSAVKRPLFNAAEAIAATQRQLNAQAAAPTAQDRPKAEFWLNVGFYVDHINESTGEVEQVFISLPVGLPLDTMQPKNGTTELQKASNKLLESLLVAAQQLEHSQAEELTGLTLQIRRVGDASTESAVAMPTIKLGK